MKRKIYILGNWKMNQNLEDIKSFCQSVSTTKSENLYCGIAPQAIHLMPLLTNQNIGQCSINVGTQNISQHSQGAYTGEVSSESAADLGATFTLVGHSERRTLYAENDDVINQKVHMALSQGLKVIFCIGETLEEREAGHTPDIIKIQLLEGLEGVTAQQAENIVIAYEPVWAIGTGQVATPEQANDVHQFIRETLTDKLELPGENMSVVYGGSMKPGNARDLLAQPNIDGGLIGGASLKADSFNELINIARESYLQ